MPRLRCADCGGDHATGLCSTQMTKPAPPVYSEFGHKAFGHRALQVGDPIGTFKLARLVGRGSTSDVYLAENEVTQAVAAAKVLRDEHHDDPEMVRRFDTEARVTNLVRHEHIVEILDIGMHDGWQNYILLEYLDGVTLGKLMERGLDQDVATRLVLQLCAGLGAAHSKGVVHRDLKPANILVVRRAGQPHVKLMDFGMAHRARLQVGEARTQAGSILGTALYMSPEQTLGGAIDARADVYSLGVVMYELATGRLPFQGRGPVEVMQAHLKTPPPRPRSIKPTLSPTYEEVILRCLEKDPDRRWASMADLGRAIVTSLLGQTPPAAPAAPIGVEKAERPVRDVDAPTQPAGSTTLSGLGGARRQARIQTSFGVQVLTDAEEPLGDALVTDLSLGGAFVRTSLTLPLFSHVIVRGATASGPLSVRGEVVRLELGEGAPRGFGLRFVDLPGPQQRILETLHSGALTRPDAPPGDRNAEAFLVQFEARAADGHYALLGLPQNSSTRRIRDVCERLAEELVAARFPALSPTQRSRLDRLRAQVTQAEEVLIDPAQRALYDAQHGNVLGVLRCITEGLDLERLDALRPKFLRLRPEAEGLARGPLGRSQDAERNGDLEAALSALADALCHDPLNAKLHRKAQQLRERSRHRQPAQPKA